jgi:DNA-directed RNA polymerase specialized sigma24 family protein
MEAKPDEARNRNTPVNKRMNNIPNTADLFAPDGIATRCIRRKVAVMLGWVGFKKLDADDIAQDLAIAVIKQLPKYDPSRARLITFISNVVRVEALASIRRQRAAKRNHGRSPLSLDAPRPSGSGTLNRAQTTGQAQARRHRKIAARSDTEMAAIQHDVAATVATLQPELASACQAVMFGRRQQVPDVCVEPIQDRFRQAAIDSYL